MIPYFLAFNHLDVHIAGVMLDSITFGQSLNTES